MAENIDDPETPRSSPDTDEPTTVLDNGSEPADQTAAAQAPPPAIAAEPAQAGPRLRDTVWNFRSMVLVAVGSLVIGGALGAALMASTTDDDGPDRIRISSFQGGAEGDVPPGFRGFGHRGQGQGPGQGFGQGQGLTDEQRQKLEEHMEKQMEKFQKRLEKLDELAQPTPTPTPTPSPSTAG